MPMPAPRGRESRDAFISRCMGNQTMVDDFPDTDQRAAVCNSQWDEAKQNQAKPTLHNHTRTRQGNGVRRTIFNGREFAILPIVMMVEGVHHGSGGPIFYPADELAKFPEAWNGRPVPVMHPEIAGAPVSCNSPEMMESWPVVGQLFNTRFEDGKLKSEAWVDMILVQDRSPELLAYIDEGHPLEVSTGMWSEDDVEQGVWHGEQYIAVARNLRPDHLALLPGAEGACSWRDGCGGPRTNKNQQEQLMEKKGGESWLRKLLSTFGFASNALSYQDKSQALQQLVDQWDRQGKIHFVRAVYDDFFIYEVVTGDGQPGSVSGLFKQAYAITEAGVPEVSGDPTRVREQVEYVEVAEGMNANIRSSARTPEYEGTENTDWSNVSKTLENYITGYFDFNPDAEEPEGDYPDTIEALPAAAKNWIAAKSLLGDSNADTFEELVFFPVVNPNTNQLNEGALDAVISGRGAQADIPEEARNSAQRKARQLLNDEFDRDLEMENNEAKANEAGTNNSNQEEEGMKINKKIKALVDGLIANEATQFTEEHREWLEGMTECQLNALSPAEPSNGGGEGDGDPGKDKSEVASDEPTANESDQISLSPEKLQKLIDNAVDKRMEKQERDEALAALKEAETGLEDEDLANMSTKALKSFAAAFGSKADYSVRGYAVPNTNRGAGEDEVPEMPAVVLAKPEQKQ